MRLDRLDLIRYGKFTDQVVDFGTPPADGPDLHVIIGANEAGKSTLFSAWRDLLYGIEMRSRYAFLHDYAALRLGAVVTLAGMPRRFFRVKAGLRDELDQSVADSAILAELGGIDRDGLTTMFSLDDDTLEKGGEAILKAKGELGQLLFAGASGLTELTRRLDEAATRAQAYTKRGGLLTDLAGQAKELADQRKRIDTRADQFHALRAEKEQAQARFDAASARLVAMSAKANHIDRLCRARPRLTQLDELAARRAPLAHWPAAPAAWAAEVARMRADEVDLAARLAANADQVDRLRAAIAALPVDPVAAELAPVFRLAQARHAAWARQAEDLPALGRQWRAAEEDLAGLCARLGVDLAAAEGLVLAENRRDRLRALVAERVRGDAALAAARAEKSAADAAWEQLDPVADDAAARQARATDLGVLAQALTQWRDPAHQGRCQLAAERADQAGRALDRCMAALAPWQGSVAELAALSPPLPEPLRRAAAAWEQACRDVADLTREADSCDAEADRAWARIDAAAPGLVDEAQVAQSRARRDAAWARHLDRLDQDSAALFAQALGQDDEVVASRMRQMTREVQVAHDRQDMARARGEAHALRRQAERRIADGEALRRQVAAAIAALSPALPAEWEVSHLETWLARRADALEAATTLRDAEVELARAGADSAARLAALAAGLRPFAEVAADASAIWLVAAVQAVQDAQARAQGQRDLVATCARRRDEAARAVAAAEHDLIRWDGEWRAAAAGTGLDADADPAILAGKLDLLAALEPALRRRDELAGRLADLEDEGRRVRAILVDLAGRLDMADLPVAEQVDAVAARIDRAVVTAQRLEVESARLEKDTAEGAALAARVQALADRQATMLAHFGVASLAQVQVALDALVQRAELDSRAADLVPALLADLAVADLAAARAAVDTADWAALAAEQVELDQVLPVADRDRLDAHQALTRAEDGLRAIGGDDAAARLDEQRRTVLAELADAARDAFALRAGLAATRAALKLYRERHRSALLARAGDAFATITRGAYRGLATQADKDGEVLVALTGAGGSKLAADLSKGTRFQLYLALRVAGYQNFVSQRPPIPFVADDIMESFDDDRAAETFRLLGQMAVNGQVIYLTHHRHLADIAVQACPGTRLHRLD